MMTYREFTDLRGMWRNLCYRAMDPKFAEKVMTRNGPAIKFIGVQSITVREPWERVLFDVERNCNHVFHLMESIWMFAGRNDVAFLQQFNSNIENYSDDGAVFHAAYGHRWRNHFDVDQITKCIEMLDEDPNDRRAIISMWDAREDGNGKDGKDFPCNVMIMPSFSTKDSPDGMTKYDRLDFTIINRSNDLVWGLCGANAVHLTMLQEFMANALGVQCGAWHHVTNNLHVYERHWGMVKGIAQEVQDNSVPWERYAGVLKPPPRKPIAVNWRRFLKECEELCNGKQSGFEEPFLEDTVEPVWASWREWKLGNYQEAIEIAECIDAYDWRLAIVQWYTRALFKKGK
jgi:thymidylate synthase